MTWSQRIFFLLSILATPLFAADSSGFTELRERFQNKAGWDAIAKLYEHNKAIHEEHFSPELLAVLEGLSDQDRVTFFDRLFIHASGFDAETKLMEQRRWFRIVSELFPRLPQGKRSVAGEALEHISCFRSLKKDFWSYRRKKTATSFR